MPAYVIVETDVHDPEQYEQYKAASPGAVAAGGGRFVARGGELAVLEADFARLPELLGRAAAPPPPPVELTVVPHPAHAEQLGLF